MKLSLITVTLNSADTLKETIKSVREQRVVDLEYIVVDGGSSDATIKMLSDNKDIVSKWISEPDSGAYDAMNKGIEMATGDIIGFLHADDRFASKNILNSVICSFENNSIDLLYGDLEYVSGKNNNKVMRYWKSGSFSFSMLKRGWMPPHPSVYFKRDIVSKIGLFNLSYTISADYEWMLRCLIIKGLNIFYFPRVMVEMRTGGTSNKNFSNIITKSREDYRAIKNNNIGGFFTLFLKNFRKIPQFFMKCRSVVRS